MFVVVVVVVVLWFLFVCFILGTKFHAMNGKDSFVQYCYSAKCDTLLSYGNKLNVAFLSFKKEEAEDVEEEEGKKSKRKERKSVLIL